MPFPLFAPWAQTAAFVPRRRAERLIAAARIAMAVFSLVAVRLDPYEPSRHASFAYLLLAAYVLYSVVVALAVVRWETRLPAIGLASHVADLAVFAVIMYLTEGPTSPFFMYFIFSLVSATLRWQLAGVVYTAGPALALFVGLGIYAHYVVHDGSFELNRFMIRAVYLAVSAALLSYLGAYETRLRSELHRLADWRMPPVGSMSELLRALMEGAATVAQVPAVWLLYEDSEEPFCYIARLEQAEFELKSWPSVSFSPAVAEDLASSSFLCADLSMPSPLVLCARSGGIHYWHGQPLHPELRRRIGARRLLSAPVVGPEFTGRLFLVDKVAMTSDDFPLAGILAQHVAAGIEYLRLGEKLRRSAVVEERMRLAGELHDGILQSLAAAALQLQTARQLLVKDPGAVDERIEQIQSTIVTEQRQLRFFVDELRPAPLHDLSVHTLDTRLEELGERLRRQWGMRVEVDFDPSAAHIPENFVFGIYRIIQEALVNAAKHAAASVARVSVTLESQEAVISVADNGHGFPFRGSFTDDQLHDRKIGPVMLKERVTSAGGTIAIHSEDTGSRVNIRLPIPVRRATHAN